MLWILGKVWLLLVLLYGDLDVSVLKLEPDFVVWLKTNINQTDIEHLVTHFGNESKSFPFKESVDHCMDWPSNN